MPTVSQKGNQWFVRLGLANGTIQTYRCATEEQARRLIATLTGEGQQQATR
jgi:hypothetical protein